MHVILLPNLRLQIETMNEFVKVHELSFLAGLEALEQMNLKIFFFFFMRFKDLFVTIGKGAGKIKRKKDFDFIYLFISNDEA